MTTKHLSLVTLVVALAAAVAGPAPSAGIDSLAYTKPPVLGIRLTGEPDVEVIDPAGRRLVWNASGVVLNEIPGSSVHLLGVYAADGRGTAKPDVLVRLAGTSRGKLLVGAAVEESTLVVLTVERDLLGRAGCSAEDTVWVVRGHPRWWSVSWSQARNGPECAVRVTPRASRRCMDASPRRHGR
jgi:hypothetical protein